MVNHFVDDPLLSLSVEEGSIDEALAFLYTFCLASIIVVDDHKTDFWLVGLDSPPI